jgi:hypothetical protein
MTETNHTNEKWCPKCGDWRPVGEFYASSKSKDGRQHYCKVHQHEYNRLRSRKEGGDLHEVDITPVESGSRETMVVVTTER